MEDGWKEVGVPQMQAVNMNTHFNCIYKEMCLSFWTSQKRMMTLAGKVQGNFLLMKFAWQLLRDVIYQVTRDR